MHSGYNDDLIFDRYRDLQDYVGWSDKDAALIRRIAPVVASSLPGLIDDFYAEIDRHAATRKTITGGLEQIERLKHTLADWLNDLLAGEYDSAYVARRWQVGVRHVEIGLDEVYVLAALSRIKTSLTGALMMHWPGEKDELAAAVLSLQKLLDLDMAIIEDAYQAEFVDRLQRNERMATLGQVASGIALELRNPLNAMKTSVYFLQHAYGQPFEKVDEHLRRLDRQVEMADGVISALAEYARIPAPKMQMICLTNCLQEAVAAESIPDNIVVTIDNPSCEPNIPADPSQFVMAVGHLIRNAVEAMPDGGELHLRVRQTPDAVELEIEDTGRGIPPERLQRIMEPLYSTKVHGIGLGLAVARAILEKHRGGLRVKSHPGRGSCFTMRWPHRHVTVGTEA